MVCVHVYNNMVCILNTYVCITVCICTCVCMRARVCEKGRDTESPTERDARVSERFDYLHPLPHVHHVCGVSWYIDGAPPGRVVPGGHPPSPPLRTQPVLPAEPVVS